MVEAGLKLRSGLMLMLGALSAVSQTMMPILFSEICAVLSAALTSLGKGAARLGAR